MINLAAEFDRFAVRFPRLDLVPHQYYRCFGLLKVWRPTVFGAYCRWNLRHRRPPPCLSASYAYCLAVSVVDCRWPGSTVSQRFIAQPRASQPDPREPPYQWLAQLRRGLRP